MKINVTLLLLLITLAAAVLSFKQNDSEGDYRDCYMTRIKELENSLRQLQADRPTLQDAQGKEKIREAIHASRLRLKAVDFWLRYLEPTVYKQINGPLPVEWETEVFEKFEAPYRREGAGLTLAELYLDEKAPRSDSLARLIGCAERALQPYLADSITRHLTTKDHFFFCNRLFLLNLAAIYTTGFECPDTSRILPELDAMMEQVHGIYMAFNRQFSNTPLPDNYMQLFRQARAFVHQSKHNFLAFDHFTFIKNYVNPLFSLNQKLIREYAVTSRSQVDYTLSKTSTSIFSKDLYAAQNTKGLFLRVYDKQVLAEIERLGKLLFFDPILSGNNERSCASCHKPDQFFTDTVVRTALHFDRSASLPRNSPSLVNVQYNHLLMLDGKHTSLQNQAKDVITNPNEMNCKEHEVMAKILSCSEYKSAFQNLLKYTPQEPELTLDHICSAITYYYGQLGKTYSPFDLAINHQTTLVPDVQQGFNLFMGKAQCATCHFVPQFNGVKPPYVGSEFEVLGVPQDTTFHQLSGDKGRHGIHPAAETQSAFRTGTVRNALRTAPYMHNGVFTNLGQVVDFYNAGGGAGRGLSVDNQTLSADSLHLTAVDKTHLIAFMASLNEAVGQQIQPKELPRSKQKALNQRKPGGTY